MSGLTTYEWKSFIYYLDKIWIIATIKTSLKFPLYFAVRINSNCETYIRENYDIYPHINVAQVWLHAVSCYWCYKENCRCFEMLIRKNGDLILVNTIIVFGIYHKRQSEFIFRVFFVIYQK